MISILSSDHYNENFKFRADFSIIAYVFVLSIVLKLIGICLFPSINPRVNAKKYKKHIPLFLVSAANAF